MDRFVVRTPRRWNDSAAHDFASELVSARNHPGEVVLDLRAVEWAQPFGTLLMAELICDLVDHRQARSLKTLWYTVRDGDPVTSAVSYLGHMGFFRHAHMPYGKQPGEAAGSSRYLPFTVVRREAGPGASKDLFEQVERESTRLAQVIHRDESAQDMLSYCFREVIRNVFEHAEVEECVLVAQRYYDGRVEFGIADRGRGVPASLGESRELETAHEALLEAIEPGVSRVSNPGDQKWENAGFGLYVLSELGRKRGEFRIVSGDAALSSSPAGRTAGDAVFPGTAVKLRLSLRDAEYFPNELHNIVQEGEAIAGTRSGGSGSKQIGMK